MKTIRNLVLILIFVVVALAPALPIQLRGEAQAHDGVNQDSRFILKNAKVQTKSQKNSKKIEKAADDVDKDYYVVYDYNDAKKVVLVRGDRANDGDEYISADNKRYVICEIDDATRTAKAKYVEDVKLPVLNVKRNEKKFASQSKSENVAKAENLAYAKAERRVGLYHTHNDECYVDEDGTDSIYGKGGIHDIGKQLMGNLENLNISVAYSENLHLPHNSGAYTRSQVTASQLLRENTLDAIFDVHRDATPRKEYVTTVNGETMSKVRMVIGSANQNSAENKEFALSIKAYADEVYPGLIKDIYIGKGNYNQQLSPRAMLFEMGSHLVEKDLVRKSTLPLAKTIDAVLYGVENAAESTKEDVEVLNTDTKTAVKTADTNQGMADNGGQSTATNSTLWIVLGIIGGILLIGVILYLAIPKFKNGVNNFFRELFPFRKRRHE